MSPDSKHEKAILDSLPEFNDDFVRGLGSDFADVEDFKKKVREMLGENKKDEAKEKLRLKIADAISEATEAEIPDVMVETELNRSQAQFEADIERMGVKLDDYLKHAKKTLEDVRKEWTPLCREEGKTPAILNSIAVKENIHPDQKEIVMLKLITLSNTTRMPTASALRPMRRLCLRMRKCSSGWRVQENKNVSHDL